MHILLKIVFISGIATIAAILAIMIAEGEEAPDAVKKGLLYLIGAGLATFFGGLILLIACL